MKELRMCEGDTEVDVDGYVDRKGVEYLGRAQRMPDGTWQALAIVDDCLCRVQVSITPNGPMEAV